MNGITTYDGYRPNPGKPRDFNANVQTIASAAHLRGVILMKGDTVVGSIEAKDLCLTLRAAHERTRGREHPHQHVVQLANGIALKIGARGAVQVSRAVWNLLVGYSRPAGRKDTSA